MKINLSLILLFFFYPRIGYSQYFSTYNSPFFRFIYSLHQPIILVNNCQSEQEFIHIPANRENITQKIIRNKKGLYILVDGTGQVYKAIDTTANAINFIRIDSTFNFGNTYFSIDFSYNDTIFSYGGYGFWNENGQLRYFREGAEWNIIKLNKEFAFTNQIYNYLPKYSCLYTIQMNVNNEASESKTNGFYVIKLNLVTKKNQILGRVNKNLEASAIINGYANSENLKGTLVSIGNDKGFYLLNFIQNKVYKLNDRKFKEIYLKDTKKIKTFFEFNNKLYYSYTDGSLDSTKISLSDFTLEPYPLYYQAISSPSNQIWYTALVFVLIFGGAIIYYKRKMNAKNQLAILSSSEPDKISGNNFNEIEKCLIELIYTKSKKGHSASVDEVNSCLGISKKSIEVQKRIRTEILNKINFKFKAFSKQESDLIIRIRSEADRRYFRYLIKEEYYTVYQHQVDENRN